MTPIIRKSFQFGLLAFFAISVALGFAREGPISLVVGILVGTGVFLVSMMRPRIDRAEGSLSEQPVPSSVLAGGVVLLVVIGAALALVISC